TCVNGAGGGAGGPPAGWWACAASKAGLEMLTRVLAAELRPRGIAVNGVAPGAVLKPARLAPARWRAITRGRSVRPADVVAAVVRFATCPATVTGNVRSIARRRACRSRTLQPGRVEQVGEVVDVDATAAGV